MSKKANARFRRHIILGIVALASLVYVATDQFDIPREDMAWLLFYTAAGVGVVIGLAACVVGLSVILRALWRRRERD